MPRYVAFLRAINVGGHTVAMAKLRAHFESLDFARVETFIASGNVIFETRSGAAATLEQRIEKRLAQALGYAVATFLRTDAEVAEISRFKAFGAAELASARAFNVGFLKTPLGKPACDFVARLATESDAFRVRGRELFWLCQKKQSESTFSNAVFERSLGIGASFRAMNTISRLAAKYPPRG